MGAVARGRVWRWEGSEPAGGGSGSPVGVGATWVGWGGLGFGGGVRFGALVRVGGGVRLGAGLPEADGAASCMNLHFSVAAAPGRLRGPWALWGWTNSPKPGPCEDRCRGLRFKLRSELVRMAQALDGPRARPPT